MGQKQASDISLTMSVWIFGQNQHWGCKLYVHAKSQPSQSVNGRDLRGGNPTSSLENSGFMTKVVGYLDVFLKVHAYNVCMQNMGPPSPPRRQINMRNLAIFEGVPQKTSENGSSLGGGNIRCDPLESPTWVSHA